MCFLFSPCLDHRLVVHFACWIKCDAAWVRVHYKPCRQYIHQSSFCAPESGVVLLIYAAVAAAWVNLPAPVNCYDNYNIIAKITFTGSELLLGPVQCDPNNCCMVRTYVEWSSTLNTHHTHSLQNLPQRFSGYKGSRTAVFTGLP